MLKVQKIGLQTENTDPVTGKKTDMTRVTFIEEGRGGANPSLQNSSNALDQVIGEPTGLDLRRTHTQSVRTAVASKLKEGDELPLFINRKLYSTPQMQQQSEVGARMIEGKKTYFTTELSPSMKDDEDHRISSEILIAASPEAFNNIQLRTGQVTVKEAAAAPVVHENLTK